MKPTIYIETSIISYLVGWLNQRDLLVASNQQLTREWWANRRDDFELFISTVVADEIGKGEIELARQRLEVASELQLLEVTAEAAALSTILLDRAGLPPKARLDSLHIAIATTNGLDYLLTWNCSHIANAEILPRLYSVCRDAGFEPPLICTPQEFIENR